MAPSYGYPNVNFPDETVPDDQTGGATEVTLLYSIILISIIVIWLILYFCIRLISLGQKTRNPQQRRPYIGTRSRNSLPSTEPTIYVSPANLPPPPKYEALAPPSYEEVVGIHYPAYLPPVQPISQPIATALANNSALPHHSNPQPSNSNDTVVSSNDSNDTNTTTVTTTITTIDERRPALTVTTTTT
ncbi:unnamed protein product [Leptidea sinapis]|uniref:Uncharacterized protein n=1 Tax=Leptidea sinapis TaxID=189913 RepID=A0A5E4QBU8_9NEOP|nr:unnamed protein product [Leptidea sinapis]